VPDCRIAVGALVVALAVLQPNLTSSKTDSAFVQEQVFEASDLP
jgi:hypothetical protein